MRIWRVKAAFLCAMLLCLCTGCPSLQTERVSLALANRTLGTTMGVLADLRRAGKLDDQQADLVNEFYPKAEAALDEWQAALEASDSPQSAIARFQRALAVLQRITREAQGEGDGEGGGRGSEEAAAPGARTLAAKGRCSHA